MVCFVVRLLGSDKNFKEDLLYVAFFSLLVSHCNKTKHSCGFSICKLLVTSYLAFPSNYFGTCQVNVLLTSTVRGHFHFLFVAKFIENHFSKQYCTFLPVGICRLPGNTILGNKR